MRKLYILVLVSVIASLLALMQPAQPLQAQAGGTPVRPNKFVGILYETWFNADYPGHLNTSYVYPNIPSATGATLWWGQPAAGFYQSGNTAVIGTQAEQIANAGVDFILIDGSNGNYAADGTKQHTWNATHALIAAYQTRISQGKPTPKIAFYVRSVSYLANGTITNDIEQIYNNINVAYGVNSPFLFKYGLKPLILTHTLNNSPGWLGCNATVGGQLARDVFECHEVRGLANSTTTWSYLETYPQAYTTSNGWSEQISVSPAQQLTYMNATSARGRNWNYRTNSNTGYQGQNFDDQWNRAKELNPTITIVTGWNQWIATRTENGGFTDEYSPEYSNDIEPMVNGHGSFYLNRLREHILGSGTFQGYKRNSPDLYFYNTSTKSWSFKEGRGGLQFAPNNFAHTFAWPGGGVYQPLVGDFNDDSKVDIGLRDPSSGVWYFAFSNGDGTFSNTRNFTWSNLATYQPVIGDFNDDGRTDIGLRNINTGVWYFNLSNGAGSYGNVRSFPWAGGAHYQPIVGDFNSDGKTDIGLRDSTIGRWYFAFSNGSGNYANTRNFNWAADASAIKYQPLVGDFDCDGLTDIGLRRADTGVVYLANYDNGINYGNYSNNNYNGPAGAQYEILSQPLLCREN